MIKDSEMLAMIEQKNLNVKRSCELFGLIRSTFYTRRNHVPSNSERRRERLKKDIQTLYDESNQIYGAPKIHAELLKKGEKINVKLVQKLMKELGIKSIVVKKFKPSSSKSDNLKRINLTQEKSTRPNQVWTTDITYIHTQSDGWVYLSTIMDRYTKQIIAWDISRRMTTDLVENTLEQAIQIKGVQEGLILHSDQGSQYTSDSYEKLLKDHLIQHSFSRKGYPYHNASQESWHGHLKREWLYRFTLKDLKDAKHKIFWYIEGFYNTKRIHEGLKYLTPNQFANQHQIKAA